MKYRLDIIAIWIKKEGGVVPRMIVAQAWWSIIRPAIFETGFVEALDHGTIFSLKRHMMTPRELTLRSVAIRGRNEELIGPDIIRRLSRNWDAERCENGRVKATAGFKVSNDQLNVVNQTTTMEFLRFHVLPKNSGVQPDNDNALRKFHRPAVKMITSHLAMKTAGDRSRGSTGSLAASVPLNDRCAVQVKGLSRMMSQRLVHRIWWVPAAIL